jgi:hypothetical protein
MTNKKLVSGAEVDWRIEAVLEAFAVKNKTRITVALGDRESFPVSRARDRLTVVFYGYARLGQYSGGSQASGRRVEGFDLERDQTTFIEPSLISETLSDREITYAEVVGNTLFILFDLLGGLDTSQSARILERILQKFLTLPAYEVREKQISARIEKVVSESWENFNGLFADSLKLEREIRAQFDFIRKIAKSALVVTKTEIRIDFGYVAMKDRIGGKKYNIGQHVCIIDIDGPNVLIFNQNKKDKRHPHIYDKDGWVCFGTIAEGLNAFVRDHEFANAVEGIRLFLAEADLDDDLS